jgi:hypothetical protein
MPNEKEVVNVIKKKLKGNIFPRKAWEQEKNEK